ncbi:hypothetical protein [Sphingomonas sp.]|uniref:hypothetical protein n=1 Tax=Sphingomonas sp. TaxID=28214 RepID=UPI0025F44F1B|nr:hypothetical protein [Sphingomonas sp.]
MIASPFRLDTCSNALAAWTAGQQHDDISDDERRRAFSIWLRSDRLSSARSADGQTVDRKRKSANFSMNDRKSVVAETESERLLKEIGGLLMEDSEYPLEPTLLYAQLDRNMVAESIFKELGNQFLFRWPMNERLSYALLELWEAQDGQDRWSEMEYVLRDGQFDVAYFHPDEIDPQEDVIERSERALQRHFGEKPIVYPPLPTDDDLQNYGL